MNPHDLSDDALHAAFAARLEAAPEPPDAMRARTLAALAAETKPPAPAWRSAGRWWSALAAPARFATAATIVIIGGTIAFGTVKATHDRPIGTEATPGTRISLDRRGRVGPQLARSAEFELGVRDVAAATRAVRLLAQREHGSILLSRALIEPAGRARATRIVLRVPSAHLNVTLARLASLGTVRSHRIDASDLAAQLTANETALERAQLQGASREVARLIAQRARLEARVDGSTIAVIIRNLDAGRTAFAGVNVRQAELFPAWTRPTRIALAGEARFCNAPLEPRWAPHSFSRSSST